MEKCAELAKLTNSNTILSELRQNLKKTSNTDQISIWEVENSIKKLKNNKSAGMDRIPAESLKIPPQTS